MERAFLAFDIEMAKQLGDGAEQWRLHRPVGAICASVWMSAHLRPVVFSSVGTNVTAFLQARAQDGYTIVTWNGLGRHFDMLADQSGCSDLVTALALDHVDMRLQLFLELGRCIELSEAARAVGERLPWGRASASICSVGFRKESRGA